MLTHSLIAEKKIQYACTHTATLMALVIQFIKFLSELSMQDAYAHSRFRCMCISYQAPSCDFPMVMHM